MERRQWTISVAFASERSQCKVCKHGFEGIDALADVINLKRFLMVFFGTEKFYCTELNLKRFDTSVGMLNVSK